jgi:hypothetical protein
VAVRKLLLLEGIFHFPSGDDCSHLGQPLFLSWAARLTVPETLKLYYSNLGVFSLEEGQGVRLM